MPGGECLHRSLSKISFSPLKMVPARSLPIGTFPPLGQLIKMKSILTPENVGQRIATRAPVTEGCSYSTLNDVAVRAFLHVCVKILHLLRYHVFTDTLVVKEHAIRFILQSNKERIERVREREGTQNETQNRM